MIFFWLGLIALTFGLLGFLLHAFYFNRQKPVEALRKEIDSLNKALALREVETQGAKEEISKTRTLVHSLDRQLEQSNEAMHTLQQVTKRQEEEIRLLQKRGVEIPVTAVRAEERQSAVEAKTETAGPDIIRTDQRIPAEEAARVPLWKENLNNVLGMLEQMEKEVKK